ncbi:MAG TPA: acetolactate synthase small subunit [Acidimicrobiales bacterium]|nr:acetolactate synthase small subunit [Acidimicrobiales bacterium]
MSLSSTGTTWVSGTGRVHHQTISVIVENQAGVLARVAALFARRGFNIISLAVAPADDDAFSRITIVVDLEEISVEQLTKQLFKLVNVVKITEMTPGESIERELLLLSVRCSPPGAPGPSRGEVSDLVRIFGGTIVDVGQEALTVMLAGQPSMLDDFEDLLRPYGIIDIQRTGRVALPKLERAAPRRGHRSSYDPTER